MKKETYDKAPQGAELCCGACGSVIRSEAYAHESEDTHYCTNKSCG
jgi:hypothetical protein